MHEVSGVARELRLARESAGLTREQMYEKTGLSVSLIDKVERAVVPVSDTYLTTAASILAPYVDVRALLKRVHDDERKRSAAPVPDWFEVWKEVIEPHATLNRVYEPFVVPGLIQTEAYARAVLGNEARVIARIERQQVFDRDQPLAVVAIIDEFVLHRRIGSAEIMHEQLQRLANPPVTVRVHILPAGAETSLGVDGSFEIATLDGTERVYVNTPVKGDVLDDRDTVVEAERRWDALSAEALPLRQSRDLILKVARERWMQESG